MSDRILLSILIYWTVLLPSEALAARSGTRVDHIAVLRRADLRTGGIAHVAKASTRSEADGARLLSAAAGRELRYRRTRRDGAEVFTLRRALDRDDAELERVLEALEAQPGVLYVAPIDRDPCDDVVEAASDTSTASSSADEIVITHLMVQPSPGRVFDGAEITRLGTLACIGLRLERSMSGGAFVLALGDPIGRAEAERIAARLR